MAFSIYEASVPVYTRHLKALSATLDKAAAYAAEKKIKPEALIAARLYPDMFNLGEQVRATCNHAVRGGARLTGIEPPALDRQDATFAELKERIGVGARASSPRSGRTNSPAPRIARWFSRRARASRR